MGGAIGGSRSEKRAPLERLPLGETIFVIAVMVRVVRVPGTYYVNWCLAPFMQFIQFPNIQSNVSQIQGRAIGFAGVERLVLHQSGNVADKLSATPPLVPTPVPRPVQRGSGDRLHQCGTVSAWHRFGNVARETPPHVPRHARATSRCSIRDYRLVCVG